MASNLLKDTQIKNSKPKDKAYKLFDGDGLFILIHPNGGKYWRLKYTWQGKEKLLALGVYPIVTLSVAREKLLEAKKQLANNLDPSGQKKAQKNMAHINTENSFESVATEWHSKNVNKWSEEHGKKLKDWIKKEITPVIGSMPINEVKAPHILEVVKRIEARGANDVARRILNICSQVFRYGMPLGKCDFDATMGINQTLEFVKRKNYKCISIAELPALIKKIDEHNYRLLTKLCLKMVVLTFVRSTELREAKWDEINLENKEWRIPAERMKMKEQHIVPLSRQVIDILDAIKKLPYNSEYIFPNENNPKKVISENTMLYALYDMGYHNKMTVHGFRQLASTILNEQGFSPDAIERQLSHAERNNVRRAYNHAQYLPERREMMQWWADYISKFSHEW